MLFGKPGHHQLTLSHERVLLPADPPLPAPRLAPHLAEIRRLIATGRAQDAADLAVAVAAEDGYSGLQWTDPLVPVATIDLCDDSDAGAADYERRVDLLSGEIEIVWTAAARPRLIRAFVSRADGIAVLDVPHDTRVRLRPPDNVAIGAEGVRGGNQERARFGGGGSPEPEALLDLRFVVGWAGVDESGASTRIAILSREDDRLLLGLCVNPRQDGDDQAGASWPKGNYASLLKRHRIARDASLPLTSVDLGVMSSGRTTEELLRDRSPSASRELLQLQLQAGASLIEDSTGEFPPTLQGIWSGTFDPAWSSDFTMNGNVQNGALAASLSSGSAAQVRTWIDMLIGFSDDLRHNAHTLFGADGYLLPSRCSIRHARTTHFDADHCHEFWTAGTPWTAAIALDDVWYTGDLQRLRSAAYPFAREAERFYESFLQTEEGQLLFSPSYSPENRSSTFASQACRNATQDRAALAVLLRGLIRSAELLDVDRHLAERRRQWLAALPPYRVAPDGTLAEWLDEGVEEEIGHRTASQLLELWFDPPAELTRGPLADAVITLVRKKLEWRDTGNEVMAYGLAQLGIAAAAVADGDLALECANRLSRTYTLPSLSFTHDHGAIFNLDGAGSLVGIVHTMLVQSSIDRLILLPALPGEWDIGAATMIHARGGLVVEALNWDGTSAGATVRALPGSVRLRGGRDVRITLGDTDVRVELGDGESVDVVGTTRSIDARQPV
ncbi:hypothetical protein QSU92_07560 [Microbacterium sp. ET2]|nr:hypothetical protein [Microbacterium sp. ET2 (Ac-2212)]WJL97286.1 hypothetical protein QSU92_07560 [Microbacterium sp. ET2 (Ac-2212)]